MASVLVIAADPDIESLMGQLVAFAGHRPVYDVSRGAAGEAVRRVRPEVTMLDVALPPDVVEACLAAADEVRSRPVLTSSVSASRELAAEADARHALYFAMPGGPKPLASLLQRALDELRTRPRVAITVPDGDLSVQRALCAALAGLAQARILALRRRPAELDDREGPADTTVPSTDDEPSRAALRAAVTDYVRQLQAGALPEAKAVFRVRTIMHDCAALVGAEEATESVLADSEGWTRNAYRDAGPSRSADAAP